MLHKIYTRRKVQMYRAVEAVQ